MDWMINVIIPAIQIIIYLIIAIIILFPLIKFLIRYWSQKLKFFLRYSIFRNKYDDLMVTLCAEAIDKKWNNIQFKMHLLKEGYAKTEIYEIMYIYNKVMREMGIRDDSNLKGGFKRK